MQKVLGSAEMAMNDIQARLNILAPESGSDVVVYYSGLGVPGRGGGASLLPADVPPHRVQSESYPLKLLYEKLGALRHTKTVRVFLDACFSGSSDGGRLVAASPVYQEPAFPEEVTDRMMILTAVTGTQLATWDRKAGRGMLSPGVAGRLVARRTAVPAFRVSPLALHRWPERQRGFPSCQDVGLSPVSLSPRLLRGSRGVGPLVEICFR